jgi:hypothetical protein
MGYLSCWSYEIWTLCAGFFGGATNCVLMLCAYISERISNNSLSMGCIFYFDSWLVLNIPYDLWEVTIILLGIVKVILLEW